jgi:hypothetical protein
MPTVGHGPVFQQHLSRALPVHGAREISSALGSAPLGAAGDRAGTGSLQLRQETTRVGRMHDLVPTSMENDGRRRARDLAAVGDAGARAATHGRQRAAQRRDVAASHPRVNADRDEDLGVGRRDDGGGGASGGDARDIDAGGIGPAGSNDMKRQRRDGGGLAAAPLLIARSMPVPASPEIGRGGLLRVEHQEPALIGEFVHARAEREIPGRLRAAVQHHDEGQPTPARSARRIEFEGQISRANSETSLDEGPGAGRTALDAFCNGAGRLAGFVGVLVRLRLRFVDRIVRWIRSAADSGFARAMRAALSKFRKGLFMSGACDGEERRGMNVQRAATIPPRGPR